MKKNWILFFLLPMLLGCSYSQIPSTTQTPMERFCKDLKHDLTFNTPSYNNGGIKNASATQRAQTIRLYNKHDCSKFDKDKS